MVWKNLVPFAVLALLSCGSAHAAGACTLSLKPETSGFFLNPILKKVLVVKVTPAVPGQDCSLMVDDEILQVNDQVVSGQRANAVMGYWKGLAKGAPRVFKVRRAGSILELTVK